MDWVKSHKLWSIVIALVILAIAGAASSGNNKTNENKTQVKAEPSTPATAKQTPQVMLPQYSLVGSSGSVHVYVISPTDATEEKLTALGKNLYTQFSADNIARISIFTDKAQAKIMADNPLAPADLQGNAATEYDKAYVAQLNTNKNTGLKEYYIYP